MKANISVSYGLCAMSAATIFVTGVTLAHAEGMQRGVARVADCISPQGPSGQGQCVERPSTSADQSCFVLVSTLTGEFSMASRTFRSLREAGGQTDFPGKLKERPYLVNRRVQLWETEALSRNASGKVQIAADSGAPVKAEIFLRHSPDSATYTRIRCSGLTSI